MSGGFPPVCSFSPDYDLSSTQGFTNNAPARCSDSSGGAVPPTSLDCNPIPALTSVTGSPQADTISSNCDFLGASASISVAAGDGADTVTAGCGTDTLDGGSGDDELDAGPGVDTVGGGLGNDTISGGAGVDDLAGGDGDDAVQAGSENDAVAGNAGADTLSGGDGVDTLAGEDGKDTLAGGAGDDALDGGADRDTLDGGDGNDTLVGGDGRDLLLPGAGTDAVAGGTSIDTVSYEDRADGTPLRISLNGAADDGALDEADAIAADVENVIGSPGADTITGDAGANDIDGGLSNDTIDPGAGPDFVDAGPGDDRITARDGAQDRIECGDGVDTAVTDAFDTVSGCETVEASRDLMPDVDNDGVPAPADCDDRNAAVRPGLPDKPGNRVDEDCSGRDAPFARIATPVQSGFKVLSCVHARDSLARARRARRRDDPTPLQGRPATGLLQRGQAGPRAARRYRHQPQALRAQAQAAAEGAPRGAGAARRLDRQGGALRDPQPAAAEDDPSLHGTGRAPPDALLTCVFNDEFECHGARDRAARPRVTTTARSRARACRSPPRARS